MDEARFARVAAVLAVALLMAAALAGAAEDDHPPPDAEGAFDVAVSPDGSVWVVGQTLSSDFPTRRPWQAEAGGELDAFVLRMRPGGRIVFATYLGGSGDDRAYSVAVDDRGYGYVSGITRSDDFPTRRALQPQSGGQSDAFLVKLAPRGDVVYSTYLGGRRDEGMSFVSVDAGRRPVLGGITRSPDFPTVDPFQDRHGGSADVFVARLARSGQRLLYSTYLGGRGFDGALTVLSDAAGVARVAGRTSSLALPGELDPADPRADAPPSGNADEEAADAFVATVSRSGKVRWVRRLAGSGGDLATSLAQGPDGELWAMGRTTSTDFPVLDPIQSEFAGRYDVWVARLGGKGRLLRSTYLGGDDIDFGLMLGDSMALDERGRLTLIGKTLGSDFPAWRALQPEAGGGYDAWVARIDTAANRVEFATFLGGAGHEFGLSTALDDRGRAWIVGKTGSVDFPTRKPIQPALAGGYDVWVGRLARSGQRLTFSTFLGGSE